MVDVADGNSWNHDIEVLKRLVALVLVGKAFVVFDNSPQVIVGIAALLLHQAYTFVEHLDRFKDFATNVEIISHVFKLVVRKEVRDELKKVLVVLQRCVLNQPNETERVADLGDTLAGRLEVVLIIGELADISSKFLGPDVRVVAAEFFLVAHENAGLAVQHVFDRVVHQELLAEIVDLLSDVAIQLVHHVSQDADAVRAD